MAFLGGGFTARGLRIKDVGSKDYEISLDRVVGAKIHLSDSGGTPFPEARDWDGLTNHVTWKVSSGRVISPLEGHYGLLGEGLRWRGARPPATYLRCLTSYPRNEAPPSVEVNVSIPGYVPVSEIVASEPYLGSFHATEVKLQKAPAPTGKLVIELKGTEVSPSYAGHSDLMIFLKKTKKGSLQKTA